MPVNSVYYYIVSSNAVSRRAFTDTQNQHMRSCLSRCCLPRRFLHSTGVLPDPLKSFASGAYVFWLESRKPFGFVVICLKNTWEEKNEARCKDVVIFYAISHCIHRISAIDLGFQFSAANRPLQWRYYTMVCLSLFRLQRLPVDWIRQIIQWVLRPRRGHRFNTVQVLGQQVDG